LLVVKCLRVIGYGLTGTLRDNPFEPDEMIYDLEHYLRMRDFMKMGKRGLQRFAGECSGSDAPQLPVGPAKIRLPLRGWRILRNNFDLCGRSPSQYRER